MKCLFCLQPTIQRIYKPDNSQYWQCENHECTIVFVTKNNVLMRYYFDIWINDREYGITLDLENNKTELLQLLRDHNCAKDIVKAPGVLKNVTPDTVVDKIKKMITFS